MKTGVYGRLAWNGISRNRQLYLPYILTCAGMVMMQYIVTFLSMTPLLDYMAGGGTMQFILQFGFKVIALFAAIFLFYSNSFLIRRRKKEFGLYNILGMNKRNIGQILFRESMIIAGIALLGGLTAGIAFSKFAELGLVNLVNGEVDYTFSVSWKGVLLTTLIFCCIFLLIFLNTLRQVHTANPIALLHSENSGEKPPKANRFFGLLGVLLLGLAYFLAVSIEEPMLALLSFFVAVILVIIATYLLFIAGSVLLCRMLQKRTHYYYQPSHFVSVASMVYRMKRNGAGLASICILATMVLVMITGSACLYFGAEDSLQSRYPRDMAVDITVHTLEDLKDENLAILRAETETVMEAHQASVENVRDYRMAEVWGAAADHIAETDLRGMQRMDAYSFDTLYRVYFIPLADYNRVMGTTETLTADQVLICPVRSTYSQETLVLTGGAEFRVKKRVEGFADISSTDGSKMPSLYVIVPDLPNSIGAAFSAVISENSMQEAAGSAEVPMALHWYFSYDTDAAEETQVRIEGEIWERCQAVALTGEIGMEVCRVESQAVNRSDFYGSYGGIFFFGILLSIVFLFATVLIIYYKQISEGYEDQARFAIMQKVGMTDRDIRRSINSQMLTVFFLPLCMAGLHLIFAFPLIHKMLMLFNLVNLPLLLITAGVSVLVFAVFYSLVYRMTSNAYYAVICGSKEP